MARRVSIQVRVESVDGTKDMTFGDGVVRIGTDSNCQVRLTDPSVLGVHAILDAEGKDVYIIDVGDSTHVNGKRVRRDRIYPGSQIKVAEATAVITFLGTQSEPAQDDTVVVLHEDPSLCIGREATQFRYHQAWCGKPIGPLDPYFSDAHRLAVDGTRHKVCPDCVAELTGALLNLTKGAAKAA